MRPLLPLDLLLDGARPDRPGAGHAGPYSPADDLHHRPPHVVWASKETLTTRTPTLGTALIQHGLKEWLGADGGTRLAALDTAGIDRVALLHQAGAELMQLRELCDAENLMPIVVCSDAELVNRCVTLLIHGTHCVLMAVGAPYARSHADSAARFPIALDAGLVAESCIWLGAPPTPAVAFSASPGGLRIDRQQLTAAALPGQLNAALARIYGLGPAVVACVLYLDDVAHPGDGGRGLAAEVFAASLRWLQPLIPSVMVFLVAQERITHSQRPWVAGLAKQLGGAMFKHRKLQRRPWCLDPASAQASPQD